MFDKTNLTSYIVDAILLINNMQILRLTKAIEIFLLTL